MLLNKSLWKLNNYLFGWIKANQKVVGIQVVMGSKTEPTQKEKKLTNNQTLEQVNKVHSTDVYLTVFNYHIFTVVYIMIVLFDFSVKLIPSTTKHWSVSKSDQSCLFIRKLENKPYNVIKKLAKLSRHLKVCLAFRII